jgi:threonine/homoserine/homoserine lactone efflux protein
MLIETWLAFTLASAVLVLIPGPTALLVMSYALGQGWRTALPMAIGVTLGDCLALTLSILGLGAVLQISATAFTILKWVGAAYLIWLGIKLWRSKPVLPVEAKKDKAASWKMMLHAFAVTALNPKSLTFFIGFLPQFWDPARDFWWQMLVMEATFLTLGFTNALGYAALASKARKAVQSERTLRFINRAGGSLLMGAGLATLALKTGQG